MQFWQIIDQHSASTAHSSIKITSRPTSESSSKVLNLSFNLNQTLLGPNLTWELDLSLTIA